MSSTNQSNQDPQETPDNTGGTQKDLSKKELKGLSGLSGVAIRQPVFITMVIVGLVVLGLFSFRRLSIDQYPDVDIPVISVQVVYAGASPETIEREVTRRLEEAFNPVEGVDNITSQSLEGVAIITVEFELGIDGDQAADDIRAKIETVRRDLPTDIEQPLVQKFDPSAAPILSLALASERMSPAELTSFADQVVRRRLESVSGVGQVQLSGGLEREIRVWLDPERLQATGVSIAEVSRSLSSQNLEVPAGRIDQGTTEQLVRVTGRISDPKQFEQVIVATRNGTAIRLGDVANVEDATEEQRSLAMLDTTAAIAMDLLKVSGANTVDVADKVNEEIATLQEELPSGTTLQVVRDNSQQIRHSVEDVIFELVLGAILTILIVMLFLNDPKATTITSLALPVSVISAFILMGALGFTLNTLTLMALSLSIGILIDDAIVVIENIVRHREMGKGYFAAAAFGTKEILLAVMATTLTLVAVFVPVAFMGGIVGRFFFQFGLTVAWAVLVSLFVSFTLTPMLAAWWGVDPHVHDGAHGERTRNPIRRFIQAFNRWFDRLAQGYRSVIEWSLRHRKSTLAMALAAFVGAIALFPLIGGGFMPESDDSEFTITFETKDGSTLAYTEQKAQELLERINTLDEVLYTYVTIGAGQAGTVNDGTIFVKTEPASERERSQSQMIVAAREAIAPVFGVSTTVLGTVGIGGARAPIAVQVQGTEIDGLNSLSETVQKEMSTIPGVIDIQSSVGAPRPEYRIEVERDMANQASLDIGGIAGVVRPLFAGTTVTRWEDPDGEERDVVISLPQNERRSLSNIQDLPLATPLRDADGTPLTVPLGQVASLTEGTAPSRIDRRNLERVITISAATTPDVSVSEASAAIREKIAGIDIPQGYSVSLGGETEQFEETAGYMIEAIVLAVILIFLILASQFGSYTQPLAIMLSLPLSLVGVLLALLITGDTLNMMSMIGVILLMGLVTKNAILLVDNANERRAAGEGRHNALVESGLVRLRPIMMTTLAMIAGMLPIAIGMGEGGGFRAPMARAVIGGLITSTLLTLIVVPVAYTYLDDFGKRVKSMFGRKNKAQSDDDVSVGEKDAAVIR